MGRPTEEKKEKTVKLRISEELYMEVVKKGNNISETIRAMIKDGINYVPQNKTTEEEPDFMHRLRVNGAAYGLTGEELALKLMNSMDRGEIVYENGSFRAESEYDMSKFESACDDRGVPVQTMLDKCAQMVYRL
jgi:hypothetical protein